MDVDQKPADHSLVIERKRAWQEPRATVTELDETKTEVLAGAEIIIYVS